MNLREINQMYDRTNKDMSRHEFVKRMQRAIDPVRVQKDVTQILHGREQQRAVDAAMQRQK